MRLRAIAVSAFKSPLWIAALASSAKSFVDNPVLGNERLNRWGLHVARIRVAARMARLRRRRLQYGVSADAQSTFARDGYVIIPDFLPASEFQNLRAEVLDEPWDAHEMRQGSTVTRRVLLDVGQLRSAKPTLASFLGKKQLLRLIRYVASTGGEPAFSIQCIMANESGAIDDPQCTVHSDTFHSTAKAWFFLHDVGPMEGPFLYVPGSHVASEKRLAWEREQSLSARNHPNRDHAEGSFRISADDLKRLGLPEPKSIAVRANTLIIADTFGFHGRTPSPTSTRRIEIYGSLRRNPFVPWTGLDPLSLPGVQSRIGSVLTMLDKLGIVRMPWRPVGCLRLDTPPRV